MGKGSSIDLGLPTEAKPEWTISLDYNEKEKEEEKKETAPKPAGSLFNDALDSDFLNGDFSKSPDETISGGGLSGGIGSLDEKITSFDSGEGISGSANDGLLGGTGSGESILGGGDDSLTTLGSGSDSTLESNTIIGVPSQSDAASDTIIGGGDAGKTQEIDMNQQSTAAVQAVVEQFSASMQAVVQQLSATVQAVEHSAEHQEEHSIEAEHQEQSVAPELIQPADVPDVQPVSADQLESEAIRNEEISEPEPVLSEESNDFMRSEELSLDAIPETESVLAEEDTSDEEVDEVEEKLTHLVNSMDSWEQSENALSEAAAMLSDEERTSAEKESQDSNEELRNLLERLEVSDSIDRMTATLQEDRADVIEQTEKDNELQDAVEAVLIDASTIGSEQESEEGFASEPQAVEESEVEEPEVLEELTLTPEPEIQETPEWTMDILQEETPAFEPEVTLEPEPEAELEPEMTPEPEIMLELEPEPALETLTEPQPAAEFSETLESVAEPAENLISSEIEITNDMFDMGYDLSDEAEDYSDENIDLSQFKGSINDADEFDAKSENSIDLDEAEAERIDNNGMDFDMSNLVAAAMSNLTGSHATEDEATTEISPEPIVDSEEPSDDEPAESEGSLSFMTNDEPEEQESTLDFVAADEPAESEGSLSFMTNDEPEEQESTLDFVTDDEPAESEGSLSFMTNDEPAEQESTLDFVTADEPGMPEEESALNSDLALEFAAAEETNQESVEEVPEPVMETQSEARMEGTDNEWSADSEWVAQSESESQPEKIKLEFEPVLPNGEVPTISGIIDDVEGDDIGSLIIEDYSEVPTVSDLENKLKKNEKEKKKHKSKESQKKKEDGFAFSLDDIGSQLDGDKKADLPKESAAETDVVAEALKIAQETAASAKAESPAENNPDSIVTTVYAKQNIRKIGKIKRTYFSLYFK